MRRTQKNIIKCRAHNEELIYCKDCVKTLKTIEIIKLLRLDSKEQEKIYKKALKRIDEK